MADRGLGGLFSKYGPKSKTRSVSLCWAPKKSVSDSDEAVPKIAVWTDQHLSFAGADSVCCDEWVDPIIVQPVITFSLQV